MRTPLLMLLLASLLALTQSGCQQHASHAAAPSQEAKPEVRPVTVTTAPLESRSIQRRIAVVGSLNALETIDIGAKVSGRVDRVLVDISDRVSPGDVLVEIDPVDYELAVEEAQRSLEQQLARVGLAELPPEDFDVEKLPAVVRSRLLVEHAQKEFERAKKLAEKGAGTLQEFEQAETNLRVEQAAERQTMIEINTTKAAIRHSVTRLETAKRQLAETMVMAPKLAEYSMLPTGGTLQYAVSKRMVAPGETLAAASGALLQLVIDDVLKLKATVPERYAGQLKVGQRVEVNVEAYPSEIFDASISRISPVVDVESRTFEVEALVPNADQRLKCGAFAKANIVVQESAEAVTAPLEAISSFAGVTKLFVVVDGKSTQVPVELGARGEGWVEVVGKVSPGMQAVTSGHSQLANGTPVEVREQVAKHDTTAAQAGK